MCFRISGNNLHGAASPVSGRTFPRRTLNSTLDRVVHCGRKVIPAKLALRGRGEAGIQFLVGRLAKSFELDSRLRGKDQTWDANLWLAAASQTKTKPSSVERFTAKTKNYVIL
jgi:hypothetical protein